MFAEVPIKLDRLRMCVCQKVNVCAYTSVWNPATPSTVT